MCMYVYVYVCMYVYVYVYVVGQMKNTSAVCEFIIPFAEILEEFQKRKRENKPEKNSTQNKKAWIETSQKDTKAKFSHWVDYRDVRNLLTT